MAFPVMFVKKDSPAWDVYMRAVKNLKPGGIIPVSEEEMESLSKDVKYLYLEGPHDTH